MRVVLQRVTRASVSVNGEIVSNIGRGICILVGIQQEDTQQDIEYMVRKILNVRVFGDDEGAMWRKSVKDLALEILSVSQFTLYAQLKGNKPDFHLAMKSDQSKEFYQSFLTSLRTAYQADKVKDGVFGAYMDVSINNDGPVTLELDSRKFAYTQNGAGEASEN